MQNTKNQSTEKVILVLIVIIGIVGGYFYYSSVASIEQSIISKPIIGKDLEQFKNISLDFSVFDKIGFKELKIFGESPVRTGQEGKEDLFAPF